MARGLDTYRGFRRNLCRLERRIWPGITPTLGFSYHQSKPAAWARAGTRSNGRQRSWLREVT